MVSASRAGETYSSLLEIIDSATSAGDPLVSLPAVFRLCFLFFSLFLFLARSLSSFIYVVLLDIAPLLRWRSFRGRRQLPQAGEVRRPRWAGVVSLCVDTYECFWFVVILFN